MDAGLLLVMSDNLRQAKTCFCEPQGPLQHRHSAGAAISAVHLRLNPPYRRYKSFDMISKKGLLI
jgi:hypothetical protein